MAGSISSLNTPKGGGEDQKKNERERKKRGRHSAREWLIKSSWKQS